MNNLSSSIDKFLIEPNFFPNKVRDLIKRNTLEVFRMRKVFLGLYCILFVATFLLSCGDVEEITKERPEEAAAISKILRERWQNGYMTEDVELYMSAYWPDGFLYQSDNGTDSDTSDDIIFDDIQQEQESAIRVFRKFQDIEVEISEPPKIEILNTERTKAEVRNHYKAQFIIADGTSLEGGYTGYYVEGDSIFTFELKKASNGEREWRITVWKDEGYSPEEINAANNLL